MTFRRFSRRRQLRALVVALLDEREWGRPLLIGEPTVARQEGVCSACGGVIHASDGIVLARVGPPADNRQTFVHEFCPDPWFLLERTIEVHDDKIITKINQVGRGRATGCGHDVDGRPVYLVRRPVSLAVTDHSDWFCEDCARPGRR